MPIIVPNPNGVPPGLQSCNNPMYANPGAASKSLYDASAKDLFFGVLVQTTAATTVNVEFYAKNSVPNGPGAPPIASMVLLDSRAAVPLPAGSTVVWMNRFRQMISAGSVNPMTVLSVLVKEAGITRRANTRLCPDLDGC